MELLIFKQTFVLRIYYKHVPEDTDKSAEIKSTEFADLSGVELRNWFN